MFFKAKPHKARLTTWRHICLHLFRHLARKLLAGRQPACVTFIQSDEKFASASAPPALCGFALKQLFYALVRVSPFCKRNADCIF